MAIQVTRLGIEMEAEDGVPYLKMQQCIQELACAVRHCAPSLRILRLRLFQTTSFRDYEADATRPDGLQSLLVGPPTISVNVRCPISDPNRCLYSRLPPRPGACHEAW